MISEESGINREDLVKVILFRAPWLKGLNDDDDFLSERVLFPRNWGIRNILQIQVELQESMNDDNHYWGIFIAIINQSVSSQNRKPSFHLTWWYRWSINIFTNIGQSLAQEIPSSEIDPLNYVNPVDGAFSFQRISVQKVIKLLELEAIESDVGKATGLDKVPNRLLKIDANVVAPPLTGIFSQLLLTGIFSLWLETGESVTIFFKSDLNIYRPVSVICTVAQIFEKNIYDQLYQYLNENGLLNSGQSGFRLLHSTLTALLETNDSWCVNIDKGILSGVICNDLKKAFVTIDHEIILKKTSMASIKTHWNGLNLT